MQDLQYLATLSDADDMHHGCSWFCEKCRLYLEVPSRGGRNAVACDGCPLESIHGCRSGELVAILRVCNTTVSPYLVYNIESLKVAPTQSTVP